LSVDCRGSEPGQGARKYDRTQSMRVTEQPHLTPLVRASARLFSQLVTGSFRGITMGGGAFNLLKIGDSGPESREAG